MENICQNETVILKQKKIGLLMNFENTWYMVKLIDFQNTL